MRLPDVDREQLRLAVDAEQLRRNLHLYLQSCWEEVINPTIDFLDNWHIDILCEYLQAVANDEIRRLIINIMPRSGKTIITGACFPTWVWATHPETQFIFASYSQRLAEGTNRLRRNIILSDWYQSRWKVEISKDQRAKNLVTNTTNGQYFATSITGTCTGIGADVLVQDDPANPKQTQSKVERDRVNEAYSNTFVSRLNNPKTGKIIIIQQRLHENDLTGYLLDQQKESGWEHLVLPIEFHQDTTYSFPLSKKVITKTRGELMWPERFPRSVIDSLKRESTLSFNGQYMQQPVPEEGMLFKREYLKYYTKLDDNNYLLHDTQEHITLEDMSIFSIVDCAGTEHKTSDYTVVLTIGRTKDNKDILLDIYREQIDTTKQLPILQSIVSKWNPVLVMIENIGFGTSLLHSATHIGLPVTGITPKKDKISRAFAMVSKCELGYVYLPKSAPWVEEFISELLQFPRSRNDDQVDTFAYISKIDEHSILEYISEEDAKEYMRGLQHEESNNQMDR